MSFLDNLTRGLERRDFTLKEYSDHIAGLFGAQPAHSGERVTVDSALGLVSVFKAVRVIAEAIHVMPCHVYRRVDRGRERASGQWQYRLLHESPNPEMAPGQFFEILAVHLNLWGNAYLEKVKGSFAGAPRVVELWPIEPKRVTVERRPSDQAKIFRIDGESREFTESTILHIPALGYNGLTGLSPIGLARHEIGAALSRQRFQGRFYSRGAMLNGVIERPADAPDWSETAQDNFKAAWRTRYEGPYAEGGTPILEDGMTYRETGMPLKDQQFIEQGNFTRTEIANLFNLPASKLNGPTGDSMTYGTREQDALEFVTFSLLPWMTRISQGLWRDNELFPSRTFYPAFLPEALLRGDAKSRAEFYDVMMNKLHVLTPNDVAEREDLPIRPDGDEFPAQPAPPAPPGGDDDEAA